MASQTFTIFIDDDKYLVRLAGQSEPVAEFFVNGSNDGQDDPVKQCADAMVQHGYAGQGVVLGVPGNFNI